PVVLVLVLVAGMAGSGLLAVTVERVAYRPLRNAPRLIPLISAIGISFFLQDLVRLFESLWRNAFNLVYPTLDALNLRFELTETLDVSVKSLVVIGGALGMLWVLHMIVNRTKVGTAIRAVAEDQAAASLMGIDVNRIISLTFLIGGAIGGAAGVLFGVQYGRINPYSGFIPGLSASVARRCLCSSSYRERSCSRIARPSPTGSAGACWRRRSSCCCRQSGTRTATTSRSRPRSGSSSRSPSD